MQTATGTALTNEQLLARIAELEQQVRSNARRNGSNIKLGDKGNIVTYGLGKFPVSLYLSQAEKLMTEVWGENYVHLREFIEANRSKLSVKTAKE